MAYFVSHSLALAGGNVGGGQSMHQHNDKAGSRSQSKEKKRKHTYGNGSSQALTSFLKRANVQQEHS